MSVKAIRDEILQLKELLLLEKQEDLKQYNFKMQNTSFAERRKNGVCWYPVRIEKSSYSSAERLMLKVSRNPEHRESHMFQPGKPVSFFSNAYDNTEDSEFVSGVVNMVRDHEMLITLNADDHPNWIYDGKLGVQLMFDENSYREMEYGIKKLLSDENEQLERLKNVLLGSQDATFNSTHEFSVPSLNESQNQAVIKVLSANEVAIIHGPPGTGKTTTLLQSIIQTLKNEKQVLVCAPSNAAVDLLVEKLVEQNINTIRIGHPARISKEVLDNTIDAHISKHSQYKEYRELLKRANEYKQLGHKYKRNFGPSEREQRKLLLSEARKLKDDAIKIGDYIKGSIIDNAKVVAVTLVGANNMALKGKRFTTVFIDEAAQGLEPACWLPIIKSDKVVFAGDHCQLPPTIKSFEAAKQGLQQTLFEKAIERNKADVMLTEQYRMHEQIMQFSSDQFYNGGLKANSLVKKSLVFKDDLPVEFIDTAGCGFFEQYNPESKSAFNPEEYDLLIKHFSAYCENLEAQGITGSIKNIGVISPYKAQVSYMQETFNAHQPISESIFNKVVVNTIDSFQGQERDVIYISLVRSNEKGEIGFLSDTRRMNVAMTRARKKLVIIGDSATICTHPFYNDFVDYVNSIGAYKSAFELLY